MDDHEHDSSVLWRCKLSVSLLPFFERQINLMNKQSLISEKAKEMIGLVVGPGESFRVDRELVLRFAESIEEDPGLFEDIESSDDRVMAPLTFPLYNCTNGIDRDFDPPLNAPRRIRGSDEFQFVRAVHEGDSIKATTQLVDIYERVGATGKMVFLVTETTYTNQRDEKVMVNRATVIRR